MKLGLNDKKVLIAGSSRGIGLGIAKAFAAEGSMVWLTGRDGTTLKAAASELKAKYTTCDLTTAAGRKAVSQDLRAQWGRLDALVLNMGSTQTQTPGLDAPADDWQRLFEANFFSAVALIKEFKDLLATAKGASIVGVSSIAGEMRLPAPLSYTTSKGALEHLCNAATPELAALGIRFNIVSPGNILHADGRWAQRLKDDPAGIQKMLDTFVPLKRFGTPDEIASFVVFLTSEKASFCTGSVVRVDGGQSPVL